MAALRSHMSSSSVNVEVDAAPQQDLAHILQEIRSQYEGIADKNRRDMEAWYKVKVRAATRVYMCFFLSRLTWSAGWLPSG